MKVVCSILILLCCVTSSFSQQTNREITKDEEQEALRIAHLFERRMRQTHDISPLIKELFVQDFLQRYRDYSNDEWLLIFRKDVARKVRLRDVRRFYIAWNNFAYLGSLYACSHYAFDNNISNDWSGVPPAIRREMKHSPFYSLFTNGENPKVFVDGYIRPEHFYSSLRTIEHLVRIYRRYVKYNEENSKECRKALADWKLRFHTFEPSVSPCDDDCVGFPKGTRFIYVNIMPFQLQLVRYKGQMKVLIAYMYFD